MEVDILIRAKDLASGVFDSIESAGSSAFQSVEESAASASAAADQMAAAFQRSGEQMAAAMEEAEPSFAAAEEQFNSLFQPLEQIETQVTYVGDASEEAGNKSEQAGEKIGTAAEEAKFPWMELGVAIAGAGATIEVLGRQAAESNTKIGQMAVVTGRTADEIRNLAIETATSADDVNEVIDLFDLAAKNGARTQDQLGSFASFWDTVADAIGGSATQLASYAPALRAVGIGLGEENKALTALSYMQTQTTIGAEGFLSTLTRMAPELKQLKLGSNDVAAVMGFLESKGITGRAAMREFGQAANEAKGNQAAFYKALGMTSSQIDEYRAKVEASAGSIEKMAEVEAEHHTLMERITNTLKEFTLENSALIESLSILAPILVGVGGAVVSVAAAWPALTAAAAAFGGVTVASVLPIVAALAAVGAAAYALYTIWTTNFGGIQEKTAGLVEYLSVAFGPGIESLKSTMLGAVEVLSGAWESISSAVAPVVEQLIGVVMRLATYVGGDIAVAFNAAAEAAGQAWSAIWEAIGPTVTAIWELIQSVLPLIAPVFEAVFGTAYETVKWALGNMLSAASDTFKAIWTVVAWFADLVTPLIQTVIGGWVLLFQNLPQIVDLVKDAFNGVVITIGEYMEQAKAKVIDAISVFYTSGKAIITTFADGIRSAANVPIEAVSSILSRIRDYLPFSDAKTGPLSDLSRSGAAFMQTIAGGMSAEARTVEEAVAGTWAGVDAQVERLMGATAARMTKKQIEEEKKQAKELVAQRTFDNMTKLQQMEQQAAAEIALARRRGQSTVEIEKYWRALIADEQTKAFMEEQKKAEETAKAREDSLKSRTQLIEEQYAREMELLTAHSQDTTNTTLYYEQQLAEERKKIAEETMAQEKKMWEDRATVAAGFNDLMTTLYEMSGEESRTFFELAKASAIAEATINSYLAFTAALKMGPIVGPIMAGIVLASGLAQVAKIAATQPEMAAGGVVTRKMSVTVGEAGPEAIIPLDRAFPSIDEGGPRGETTVLNFNTGAFLGRPYDARKFARDTVKATERERQRRGY